MKKLLCLGIVLAIALSLLSVGVSAALPLYEEGEPVMIVDETFTEATAGQRIKVGETDYINHGLDDSGHATFTVVDSGEEAYGNVLNLGGSQWLLDNMPSNFCSYVTFGKTAAYDKFTLEFDVKANYASAPVTVILPWGDTEEWKLTEVVPAYFMLAPALFTDAELVAADDGINAIVPEGQTVASDKWYHVTVEVDNKAMKSITQYTDRDVVSCVDFKVEDLSTNTVVEPTKIMGTANASAFTDSVTAGKALSYMLASPNVGGLNHIGLGIYSPASCHVVGEDGTKTEKFKSDYYFDNIKVTGTTEIAYDVNDVLYCDNLGAIYAYSAVAPIEEIPGGAITETFKGYDYNRYVATFDVKTDADMFVCDLYGADANGDGKINSSDRLSYQFRIPVEEAARGVEYSYKIIPALKKVYRAPKGTDAYAEVQGIKITNVPSGPAYSGIRIFSHSGYGATTGTYYEYDNVQVVYAGAMALKAVDEVALTVAMELGANETVLPVLAFFDQTGRMVGVSNAGQRNLSTGEAEVTFVLPGVDYTTAQVFLWDSVDGLVPLTETPWVLE